MRISEGAGVRRGLIAAALAAWAVGGCGGESPDQAAPPAPRRVVCASPAVAEIVFALGCGDRVVGVSDFTDWPPGAAAKPSIGGALSPNRERILALAPDLVLAQGRSEALGDFARAQGLAFRARPLDTLEDLRAAIADFAGILGAEAEGRRLIAEMAAGFATVPKVDPIPVFLALGHAPGDLSGLMTAGPGTFLSEIVARAGGINVFGDVSAPWPEISQETLIRRKPAIILDFQSAPVDEARRAALAADWERLGFHAGQIRVLTEDYLLKPGPRAVQAAVRIAAALGGE